MFGLQKYNYESFSKDLLKKDALSGRTGGPKPGEHAPNFSARALDGGEVSLSDYHGESNVVLTFGSATCPFTASSISGMNDLYEDYNSQDVQFLFVYVREAHPGERLPAHRTLDDKVHAAEVFRGEEQVEMPVLVDALKGNVHKKYGKLPNPTYLIDKSGRVAFRCLWTRPSILKEALQELLERQRERDVDHAIVHGGEYASMPATYATLHAHRALDRGGHQAICDFRREMGVAGRVAETAGRVLQPVAESPGRIAAGFAITVAVVSGAILLGRYLRRLQDDTPYDIERPSVPPRSTPAAGGYEAVGI